MKLSQIRHPMARGNDALLAVCLLTERGLIDFAAGLRWGLWLDAEAEFPVGLWTRRVR